MAHKQAYGLRIKVLAALTIFLVLVILAALFQLHTLKLAENNHQVLGQLSQLESAAMDLQELAQLYDNNAPRDYPSYDRDVVLFLPLLNQELDSFGEKLAMVEQDFAQSVGILVPKLLQPMFGDSGRESLAEQVSDLHMDWEEFRSSLADALGDDPAEPLLEAGAEYLIANTHEMTSSTVAMIESYRTFLHEQSQDAQRLTELVVLVLIILGVLGLVWFFFRVIQRIGRVVDACQHVALGEFGYTVSAKGNDELSVLARAFNTLSARSQLVLAMLTDLQRAQTVEQGLSMIVQASGSYLPVAWAGFGRVDSRSGAVMLSHAIPPKSISNWTHRTATRAEPFGKELADALVTHDPILLNDLKQRGLAEGEDFLRELVRATSITSLVALPLSTGEGWEGFVFFGSKRAQYQPHQVELLKNLAPSTSISFARLAS